ncbi:putative cysteine desulfurase [Rubripirellula lacrimiformis]|uniref:cysteine desulfurase n=1 Tax=Rubripirellula lacrimiformis TaxID=1930273 RepID=A0A517NJA9_9BACT|nr:aminotransferase class V-fold PLP-dependent enzyme [Rubripirellula lacrimiformis]QDT07224.1 putative cysteine desulfurase [Rubripirellula lacrimiformis]
MTDRKRIYLDHAATSWPKADSVLAAVDDFARHCGAAAGRGGYASAQTAGSVISRARHLIATQIGAPSDDCISLHHGGTDALNAAIHGILRPGDHVVTTAAEHNSVLRPLHHWKQHHGIRLTIVPTDRGGQVDADQLLDAVTDQTRLVAVMSASNVTGAVQPIDEIGKRLSDHPAAFLCDAAQTFGTLPIDVGHSHIDLLAAPGHKSIGGPSGTGFLFTAPRLHDALVPSVQGGTGSHSESLDMPAQMPSKLEAGNLNVPAIAGLVEALKQHRDHADPIVQRSAAMAIRLHQSLAAIDGVTLHAAGAALPIASITVRGCAPSDLAAILDAQFGIETRSGLHCAAMIHGCIATDLHGTLRISAGHTSSDADIDAAIDAIRTIAAALI